MDSQPPPPAYENDHAAEVTVASEQSYQTIHASISAPRQILTKPIAIPATLAKYGSPFLRAYPPILAAYAIDPVTFLSFLDNLNRVAVKSPPLQALDLAGNLVSMVPSGVAQITGGAIGLAAGVAAGVLQHGRTEHELRRANAELFGPHGLKVEIAKTKALIRIAGVPGMLDATGEIDKRSRMLEPLAANDNEQGMSPSAQWRRLSALQPYISGLEIAALPQIEMPTNAMSRVSVKASERQREKGERKLQKQRTKSEQHNQKVRNRLEVDYLEDIAKIDAELDKQVRKIDSKLIEARLKGKAEKSRNLVAERERAVAKREKEHTKIQEEYQGELGNAEEDTTKRDKEEKSIRKLHWLIIRMLED